MTAATKLVHYYEPCNTCGRVLVTAYSNGTFDLAGRARVEMRVRVSDLVNTGMGIAVAIPGSAICFRPWCRVRRWWRAYSAAQGGRHGSHAGSHDRSR